MRQFIANKEFLINDFFFFFAFSKIVCADCKNLAFSLLIDNDIIDNEIYDVIRNNMSFVNFNSSLDAVSGPKEASAKSAAAPILPPQAQATANKVVTIKPSSKFYDFCCGMAKSRIFRAILFAAAVVTAVALTAAALAVVAAALAKPATWVVLLAVAVTAFAIGIILQLPFQGKQKISFECTAFIRLFKRNFDEIRFYKSKGEGKIFLGAIPNRLINDGKKLQKEAITAVLSLNEPWERNPVGLSLPYNAESWKEFGVNSYKRIDAKDHKMVDKNDLHRSAKFIHDQVANGQNVYVHCRAGVGRSAMAVAAYLIKHQGLSVQEACAVIKASRHKSTIHKKTKALDGFKECLEVENKARKG